jgi:hypothetical protein
MDYLEDFVDWRQIAHWRVPPLPQKRFYSIDDTSVDLQARI